MIVLYNAIAGACAEDKANAGGGSPPAGITPPSQIYTAESIGGSVGAIVNVYGVNFLQTFVFGALPLVLPPLSGTATNNASIGVTNQTSVGQPFNIRMETTISANGFNLIMNNGFTGGNTNDMLFIALGFVLESPNGTASSLDYRISGVQSTLTNIIADWPGDPSFAPFNRNYVGNNWPLQDSTDFTNGHLLSLGPTSNGVVGGLGAHGTLTTGAMQSNTGNTFSGVSLQNAAGRSGGSVSANAGEFIKIFYELEAQVGGSTETTIVEYRLTLS